jgi:hypothetical protein
MWVILKKLRAFAEFLWFVSLCSTLDGIYSNLTVVLIIYYQVKGPSGEQIRDFRDWTGEKFHFVAPNKGIYRFCFTNRSPYHETIDFDVHVGHFALSDEHAKDGERLPLSHFFFF